MPDRDTAWDRGYYLCLHPDKYCSVCGLKRVPAGVVRNVPGLDKILQVCLDTGTTVKRLEEINIASH